MIAVGTSGFSYPEWRGIFYPQDLSPKKYLAYYGQHFSTTEVNNTFYRIPSAKVTEAWYGEVAENFCFTLKLSQKVTHRKRLKDCDEEMGWFLKGAAGLKEKLGPILVQLPPYLRKDPAVLEDFLGRYATQGKLAFEFRHESWFEDGVYDLLAKYGAAFGVVEAEEREARREVTGPFVYVRLRKGEYSKAELRDWAKWMRSQSVDVFCYMKHDERAPVLAREMLAALEKV